MAASLLALAQCWSVRHFLYSDGSSYLQIAFAYINGDWNNAINSYWSPLYSWLLAVVYLVFRPATYWQVSTLHLVNAVCFIASFGFFELFMQELMRWKERYEKQAEDDCRGLPTVIYFLAGYTSLLFEGLSQVHIGNTSPDMLAMALTILLSALIFKVQNGSYSRKLFGWIGITSAALFLARTAFAPCIPIVIVTVVFLVRKRGLSVRMPAVTISVVVAVLTLPFVALISQQVGHFTIGEAGKLNYAWEVNTAPRFRHWQGIPKDLGVPEHPTKLVVTHPKTYTFFGPVGGTYPLWYNPAYWYAGIRPHLDLRMQLKVWAVNCTVLLLIFTRSPIFIPSVLLTCLSNLTLWWRRILSLGPVLIVPLATIGVYSLVYVERRYIAGSVLLIWMCLLASVPTQRRIVRRLGIVMLVTGCVLFLGYFILFRQMGELRESLHDVMRRKESAPNTQFEIANRVRSLGIKPGDRVAYIGTCDMADWTRLDKVRIVAEVPVEHTRNRGMFNNLMIDNNQEVDAFWHATPEQRGGVLSAFKAAGVKIVVTDGQNPEGLAESWPLLLPDGKTEQRQSEIGPNPAYSRYLLLY